MLPISHQSPVFLALLQRVYIHLKILRKFPEKTLPPEQRTIMRKLIPIHPISLSLANVNSYNNECFHLQQIIVTYKLTRDLKQTLKIPIHCCIACSVMSVLIRMATQVSYFGCWKQTNVH